MTRLLERDGRSEPETVDDAPRPLIEHLEELRDRIIRSAAGWGLGTAVSYACYPRLLPVLIRPPIDHLIYTSPTEPFFTQCKIAAIAGVILSFPWLMYQAGAFVSLGLKPSERGVLFRLIPASYVLFLLGGAIGLFGAAPISIKFLFTFGNKYLVPYITLNAYLTYIGYMTLGLGLLFQLPIVLFVLASLGFVRLATLRKYRRHVFLAILIAGAALSPDIFGQLLIALPTYLLYELSILVIRLRGSVTEGESS